MYKIMTKLHTLNGNIYSYYTITNDEGQIIEYETESLEEAGKEALAILNRMGTMDLRVVKDEPYYLDLQYVDKCCKDEYESEQDAEVALKMMEHIGWGDIEIRDNKPYKLDLIFGVKPQPEEELYTLTIICPEGVKAEPDFIEQIKKNSTVSSIISFEDIVQAFHLIIDGVECTKGIPSWIEYECINCYTGKLTFNGITQNHVIEIVVDEWIYSI